jgi:hypothetical protein
VSVSANQIEDPEMDLRALAAKIAARRWWIIGAVLGVTAVALAAAFLLTPVYRASAVMIPASADRNSLSSSLGSSLGQLGGLAALAGVTLGTGDTTTEESIAVLKSRRSCSLANGTLPPANGKGRPTANRRLRKLTNISTRRCAGSSRTRRPAW